MILPKKIRSNALKTASKRVIKKKAEATGDLIGSKIANIITKVSRTLPQNSSETGTNEAENIRLDIKIPKGRHISPGARKLFIS